MDLLVAWYHRFVYGRPPSETALPEQIVRLLKEQESATPAFAAFRLKEGVETVVEAFESLERSGTVRRVPSSARLPAGQMLQAKFVTYELKP